MLAPIHAGLAPLIALRLLQDRVIAEMKNVGMERSVCHNMYINNYFNKISQFAIPVLTVSAILALSLKQPVLSLFLNLSAQPFWFYSTWKAYKKAGQIGMLINTFLITIILSFGIFNYLFL
jgi:hypothetical protein